MTPPFAQFLCRHQMHYLKKTMLSRFAVRITVLLLVMNMPGGYAFSQERVLHYTIKRNSDAVGILTLRETKAGNHVTYKLQSSVKSTALFTVTVKTQQEAIYENGVLSYLRFYQTLNNSERVNTVIEATDNGYMEVSEKNGKFINKEPITYNQICLYTIEPLHRKKVFADKFKQFITVETLGPHHYKITFPDGGSNEYYYKDGLCVKGKLTTTLFTAELELTR